MVDSEFKTVGQLTDWEDNPRYITPNAQRLLGKSLDRHGDLSGIVFNIRNSRLVTAHQRTTWFSEACEVSYSERFTPALPDGTVAYGYVEHDGEMFAYREVDWDEEMHASAAIAANHGGGRFDNEKLRKVVGRLGVLPDVEVTGLDSVSYENFLGHPAVENQSSGDDEVESEAEGEKSLSQAQVSIAPDTENAYSDLKQVILIFGLEEFEYFNSLCSKLCSDLGAETKAEAVLKFLAERYAA